MTLILPGEVSGGSPPLAAGLQTKSGREGQDAVGVRDQQALVGQALDVVDASFGPEEHNCKARWILLQTF